MKRWCDDYRIDKWIDEALDGGVVEFGELVTRLRGVSPPEVAERLRFRTGLPKGLQGLTPHGDLIFGPYLGRVPHALDYDWRFSAASIERLSLAVRRHGGSDPSVALFGCPSLLRSAIEVEWPSKVVLFDRNPMAECLARTPCPVLGGDILSRPIPSLEVDVAVVDPPWYLEYQRGFLWAAAVAVRAGGFILASAPPEGSRPTIIEEWTGLAQEAREFGLDLVEIEKAALPYLTPPFEGASFKAARCPRFPVDWRRGDLAIFRKSRSCLIPRPRALSELTWVETEIHGVRFMVRSAPFSRFDPHLQPIVDGDVLHRVSRRDPLRTHVAVWTSGNRVYGSNAPRLVSTTLEEMRQGCSVGELAEQVVGCSLQAGERTQLEELRDTLSRIVSLERLEYVNRRG